jgi:hypothetical protein
MVNPSDYFEVRAREIRDSLTHFMLNHSSIAPRMAEEQVCVGPKGDRNFANLDEVGIKMQGYLSLFYDKFFFELQTFLKDIPRDKWDKLNKSSDVIFGTIEHSVTFCESSEQALQLALAALDEQMKILKDGMLEQKGKEISNEVLSYLPPHDNEE